MGFSCRVQGAILSSFLFFAASASLFSHAADNLSQGQSIKDGQTIVSDSKFFELGFFSPENSTNRYVGIWYHNLESQSVVWVANRENPVTDSSGSFTIGRDGNLLVLDGKGDIKWSSNSSTVSNNSSAKLMDSGNLVLRSSDASNSSINVLWESFDHPTDTILPGMKISLDLKTGERVIFRSWKGPNDPSAGKYSLGLDPYGSPQIFIWEGSTHRRWRTGEWDGQTFIGTGLRPLHLYGFKLINDAVEGKMYFIFTEFNGSHYKFLLQWDGVETASVLVQETKIWKNFWSQPVTACQIYNQCGNNAKCDHNGEPICSCLKGYNPKSPEEWIKGNWSSGCIRRIPLKCESSRSSASDAKEETGDGFFKLEALKLPDLSEWAPTAGDAISCEDFCMHNCSCKAYAFLNGIGCMIWGSDLVDIQQFSSGSFALYVKLAPSELLEKSKTWLIIVVTSIVGVAIFIISFFLWWKCKGKIRDSFKKEGKRELSSVDLNSSIKFLSEFSGPTEFGEESRDGKGSELPWFTFDSIAAATSNFNYSNKLGEGGFGTVYKGLLVGGQEIAVKRLSRSSGQGLEEFKNEVILIAKLQHRNLVRLMGCCIQGEEKLLIYEYMPNKSLDAILFDPTKKALLDWSKRFNIIEGIARGLLYLHQDSRLRIVHRDLKAANILLDEEMNPRISDFGMARIFGGTQNQANTNRVVGTYGYMSPEYAMEGLFSIKSDVYSFGVIVLEIVSGSKNNSFQFSETCRNLIGHAWQLWNEDKALELIDPSISSSSSSDEALRCIQIALLCVQDRANDRPTMSSVIFMLGSENPTFTMPKQPSFTLEGSSRDTGSLETDHYSFSNVNEPITTVTAR